MDDELYECAACGREVHEVEVWVYPVDDYGTCGCRKCQDKFKECTGGCDMFYLEADMKLVDGQLICDDCISERGE